MTQEAREEFCIWLVKEILFGNLTPEQEQAAKCLYHNLQMKISEKEQKKIGLQSLDSCRLCLAL